MISKNNPQHMDDDEIRAEFVVNEPDFASVMETISECDGRPNKHQIIIGPRGIGKTMMVMRIAAELRTRPDLADRFIPVALPNENYEIGSPGELWRECLRGLADECVDAEAAAHMSRIAVTSGAITDDYELDHLCFDTLADYADRVGKRLVLLVEELCRVFNEADDPDFGWRVRKHLQTDPQVVLIGTATHRFNEMVNPDRGLWESLRDVYLRPLDAESAARLWNHITGQIREASEVANLNRWVGGNPRYLAAAARRVPQHLDLLAQCLTAVVDEYAETFDAQLRNMPPQARRVFLALIKTWSPQTCREVADRIRISTTKCSAQLNRLAQLGFVAVADGSSPRHKLYQPVEPLWRIRQQVRACKAGIKGFGMAA